MRNKYYGVVFLGMITFLSLFLMSCVTSNNKSAQNLNDIITQYWSLRIADKYEETYKYESKIGLPDYNDYIQRARLIKRFEIKSISLINTEQADDKVIANIEFITIMPPVSKPFKNLLKDEWIMEDGKWRHIFR